MSTHGFGVGDPKDVVGYLWSLLLLGYVVVIVLVPKMDDRFILLTG